jgi:hypothetical protein
MMKEVVCHVIAHVAEEAAGIGGYSGIPIVEEQKVGNLPERSCQDRK